MQIRPSPKSLLLVFDEGLEAQEAFIPFRADLLNPLLKFRERFLSEGIELLLPLLLHGDQACIFENAEMLEDPLARDGVFFCKLGRRPGAMFDQVRQ